MNEDNKEEGHDEAPLGFDMKPGLILDSVSLVSYASELTYDLDGSIESLSELKEEQRRPQIQYELAHESQVEKQFEDLKAAYTWFATKDTIEEIKDLCEKFGGAREGERITSILQVIKTLEPDAGLIPSYAQQSKKLSDTSVSTLTMSLDKNLRLATSNVKLQKKYNKNKEEDMLEAVAIPARSFVGL
mmetsp:Transcript_6274/g.7083  ORF Transcript_6274/g.7083 Transcript_6274/m.7083 type:complete len:188 (+) Transcript_6274:115-678(+)|eukprot:CAMPEP_0114991352 /NCGR_PEP_ID=MMETSP0216-20121206/11319_1 /TAXON_ID=223996 /ORGANISM="Protocruzia adherens, Strain Boccale" /LENGTH=187 /DNA_ID=CAMNT_0002354659 /DNA_START=94 /DNA_END=657 /DNA_ORIENTATION=-